MIRGFVKSGIKQVDGICPGKVARRRLYRRLVHCYLAGIGKLAVAPCFVVTRFLLNDLS